MPQTILTIGNFDGLHLAHQNLIQTTKRLAEDKALASLALILSPHPIEVLTNKQFHKIMPVLTRKKLIENMGIQCEILNFTPTLAKLSAEEFCSNYLLPTYNLKHLVIGYDFQMGNRSIPQNLEQIAHKLNFQLTRIAAQEIDINGQMQIISSSKIRHYLENANIQAANTMLGRNYFMQGKVIYGYQRGRALGFPTANLEYIDEPFLKFGVYKTLSTVENIQYNSITNIGINPSFGNTKTSVETHILNFDQDIYNQEIKVEFLDFLRPEKKFANLNELKEQINQDIKDRIFFVKG